MSSTSKLEKIWLKKARAIFHGFAWLAMQVLKVERVSHKVVINGCKDYVMDDVVKIKGVSGRAVQTADSTYRQWQSISTLGAMRRGNLNRCEWRLIEKHLSRDYAKGHHDTTTGAISPLILPES